MRETDIFPAIHTGIMDLKFCDTTFNPNTFTLASEIMRSKHNSGLIILPSNNSNGYETVKYSASDVDIEDDGVTVDDLWACTKEHYGLTAAAGILGAASIPIEKIKLGYRVAPGSSKYTNLSSHIGTNFSPRALLRSGSSSANIAKTTFGTIRVFGIIGRALPFAAIGLAVYDVISIGQCVYKK
ncbi:MAG: hypothetical protein COC05_01535 [Gammaproteobacteria bacterium]|nr:hypothetical protein [Beggiatoa alba]PCH61246.1 MAG: hypothetical protein COC05_01535 [Gammaproteobacteria bacterium]